MPPPSGRCATRLPTITPGRCAGDRRTTAVRRSTRQGLELELLEMGEEEVGLLEHPIVVDRPSIAGRRDGERRLELARESFPVGSRQDRITIRPQDVGRKTGLGT